IFEHRRVRRDCSPSTQRMASLILLFPLPLGPTTEVIPRWKLSVVLSGNVLNPCNSKDFKLIRCAFPFPYQFSFPQLAQRQRVYSSLRGVYYSPCAIQAYTNYVLSQPLVNSPSAAGPPRRPAAPLPFSSARRPGR